jgi:Leu/Phe-tRNA-protein transferase
MSEERPSWGAQRPRRLCAWAEEDARVAILVPRFGRGRIGRKLEQWLRSKPYRVHLDDIGAFVWQQCDGATTVDAMAHIMRQKFGERVEPVEERLVTFLEQLLRGRFVAV